MSDHEDYFEDALEGPTPDVELADDLGDTEVEFDMREKADLQTFDDEYDRQELLRQAQETEQLAEKEEEETEIIDDGHERSIEEAAKAKAEGNE